MKSLSRQRGEDPGDRVVAQSYPERGLTGPDPAAMVEVPGQREEGHRAGAVGDSAAGPAAVADEGSGPRRILGRGNKRL